ncbi:MAG: hypothetical protein Q8R82_14000 [Hyphomonadaceae bacterium]|nr:hypothetical protein [Hyphomonadaceae bacterium]
MSKADGVNITMLEDAAMQSVYELLGTLQDLIDGKFGEGYAAKHPAILAGCVQASAIFYLAERLSGDTALTDGLATVADLLATRLDTLDDAVDGLLERERGEAVGMGGGEVAP